MTMSKTPQPVVLLIGECDYPQFRHVFQNTESRDSSDQISTHDAGKAGDVLKSAQKHTAKSIQKAISLIGSGELIPDLVVSYQSIPDEYSSADIDQLIGMLPLSRFVVAFSPWCESIGRTEQRWPSAWSVPAAHAAARIRFELRQLATGQLPLPATTSRDEAFSTLAASRLGNAEQLGLGLSAKVHSADAPLKDCFESVVQAVGFRISDVETPDVHILVAAFIDDATRCRVQRIRESGLEATIIVASDMATPGQVIALREAGAASVISQLRFAEDLVDHLSSRPPRETHDSIPR